MIKKEDNTSIFTGFAAGQIGALNSENYANATDAMIEGMDKLLDEYNRLGNNPNKHGNLFEFIERAKFNTDAALKGRKDLKLDLTASPNTESIAKDTKATADGFILKNGEPVKSIQYKNNISSAQGAYEAKNPKYHDLDEVVVPSDKFKDVKKLTDNRADSGSIYSDDYKRSAEQLQSETKFEEVRSEGTTTSESRFAKEHPKLYSAKMEFGQLGKEIGHQAGAAAVAGGVIQGAISYAKNLTKVASGELSGKMATKTIAIDTLKGSGHGAAIGGTGVLIRFTAEKALKSEFLSQGNVATAIAAGLIQSGVGVYKYAKGEISEKQLQSTLAKTGFSTSYGIYMGAAFKATIGTATAATIATTAGFFIANFAYDTIKTILDDANLSEEEAARLEKLGSQIEKSLREERKAFEKQLNKYIDKGNKSIKTMFDNYDKGVADGDTQSMISSLSIFTGICGKSLIFKRFIEFDDFMLHSRKPLVI